MTRTIDIDVEDHGSFWVFHTLTQRAKDYVQRAMPDWPFGYGLRLDLTEEEAPHFGRSLIERFIFDGMTVDFDGQPVKVRTH